MQERIVLMLKWYIIVPFSLLMLFIYMFVQAAIYKTRFYNLNYGIGLRILHLTDIHINLLLISSARLKEPYQNQTPIIY